MKGFAGESGRGGGGGGSGREGGEKGWAGPPSLCCLDGRPVLGQLLIHSSFATTTNRRPHKGRPSRAGQGGTLAESATPPKKPQKDDQFLHCRYGNRAVSIGVFLKRVFSFLSPFPYNSTVSSSTSSAPPPSTFLSPVCHPSPPPPLTCFSGTNQQLSMPRSEQVHWPLNKPLSSNWSQESGCWFKSRQQLPRQAFCGCWAQHIWSHDNTK